MRKIILASAMMFASAFVAADSVEDVIREQLKKLDSLIQVTEISAAPLKGMYEVQLNTGEVIYSDAKGEYFILGKIYQLSDDKGFVNLTDQKQQVARSKALASVSAADLITYKAKGKEKSSVYVFTDVDCPYCRKLHQEVPKLQELGVSVHYLAFPRGGKHRPAFQKMTNIWCAKDRVEAMDLAKGGRKLADINCESPVNDQFLLGQKVGVTGTPAVITMDGEQIGGYMAADLLAAKLGIDPSVKN